MSVLGGFYGWRRSLKLFFAALIFGAVWSVIKLVHYGNARERFDYLFQYLKSVLREKGRKSYRVKNSREKSYTIPFTMAILMAYVSWMLGGVC